MFSVQIGDAPLGYQLPVALRMSMCRCRILGKLTFLSFDIQFVHSPIAMSRERAYLPFWLELKSSTSEALKSSCDRSELLEEAQRSLPTS